MDQMAISAHEAARLRKSPMLSREHSAEAAALFYSALFEHDPEVKQMFPADMLDQQRKFSATLTVAVNALSDWEALAPVLEALARRHLSYGVAKEHYGVLEQALLETLEKIETSDADIQIWLRVYRHISDHMIATAYG